MAKSGKGRASGRERLGEFGIIARYFAPLATDSAALGLRDDTAVLRPPEGQEIVLSCDTIVEGVHFRKDDPPDTIAHKALAVNLSDLAAKGARPYVYLLALSLPAEPPGDWLGGFADGLRALQERAGICLAGGDTTEAPGPVSITVTVLGLVPQGHAVLRHGAKPGDRLYVSGTIGDAHLGLRLLEKPALAKTWGLTKKDTAFAIGRYQTPEPRTDLTLVVRNFAQAALDVSDGLVLDVEKLAGVSHVGAVIEAQAVPLSSAGRKAVKHDPKLLETLITAGDDYEIVAAVPSPSAEAFEAEARGKGVVVTPIGRIEDGQGEVSVEGRGGKPLKLARKGFSHF
jgi:thiamine-monophosphate kinase